MLSAASILHEWKRKYYQLDEMNETNFPRIIMQYSIVMLIVVVVIC